MKVGDLVAPNPEWRTLKGVEPTGIIVETYQLRELPPSKQCTVLWVDGKFRLEHSRNIRVINENR
jgi:hypothetical protein